MMQRLGAGGSGGGAAAIAAQPQLQQLRERVQIIVSNKGTDAQKAEYLRNYFSKWCCGRSRLTYGQFFAALQSLGLPLGHASEAFGLMERGTDGTVDVMEFIDGMLGGSASLSYGGNVGGGGGNGKPPVAPGFTSGSGNARALGGAMRSVGNSVLASGGVQDATLASVRQGNSRSQGPLQPPTGDSAPRRLSGCQGRIMSAGSNASAGSARSRASRQGGAGVGYSARSNGYSARSFQDLPSLDLSQILLEQFRVAILQRCGAGGLHSLARRFKIMDDDGDRAVNLDELSSGLADIGLHLSEKDVRLLLGAVDRDGSGSLSYEEFIIQVRGEINPRREQLINMAFDVLDRTKDGYIKADDIERIYDVSYDPQVRAGRVSKEHALEVFLNQFDCVQRDGVVTRREFLEYYRSVSASIEDDNYFELMIRNSWHIMGGQGVCANTANTRVLVTFEDGSQQVVPIEHDLGLNLRDPEAVLKRLEAQGVYGAVSYTL